MLIDTARVVVLIDTARVVVLIDTARVVVLIDIARVVVLIEDGEITLHVGRGDRISASLRRKTRIRSRHGDDPRAPGSKFSRSESSVHRPQFASPVRMERSTAR
ncbi:hypothetical protein [Rhodococcus sp. IEGM 1379]|uniref:hypothetical protein n=1 Tax=Rhodococcus sp. IEGM 1379 TaxID=3047086 RepID=UPI0024B7E467|nr:hypothetical protein [Rhodococcus sp. IEGM 1379]MDI9916718.1 hypothetical protein [Rhodococcus sp. IEGM 1379]